MSAAIMSWNSAGEVSHGSAPSFASFATTSGEAIAWRTAALSRCTIGSGVPAGATSPYHCEASKPGRAASAIVGSSGSPP